MKVEIPTGQKCQWFENRIFGRCREPADYGLVAAPNGGLVIWICAVHADFMEQKAEAVEERFP